MYNLFDKRKVLIYSIINIHLMIEYNIIQLLNKVM